MNSVGNVDPATYRIDGSKHYMAIGAIFYAQSLCYSSYLATRIIFYPATQGGCAYQYFVGTSGSTITRDNVFIEVMAAGKLRK